MNTFGFSKQPVLFETHMNTFLMDVIRDRAHVYLREQLTPCCAAKINNFESEEKNFFATLLILITGIIAPH